MADLNGNGAAAGLPDRPVCMTTSGVFLTESDAWKEFDRLVRQTDVFNLYEEVPGEYIQPRPDTEAKGARIDRLLVPKKKAVDLGWTDGIIGVEGKRTGVKIGRLVCQAIDYTRCIFHLSKPIPGVLVMPRWVFIYPAQREYGDLESVMAQNRIGTCNYGPYGLAFQCSAFHAIEIGPAGSMTAKCPPMGRRRGCR